MAFPIRPLSALTVCLACAAARPEPPGLGGPNPGPTRLNTNALIIKYREKLKLSASSTWPGWPPENAVDGKLQTSWFSAQDDSVGRGKAPWYQVTFPADVVVSRVTIYDNRDPAWLEGFSILAGKVELFDANGKLLKGEESEAGVKPYDFDFVFRLPVSGVRSIRFTSLGDEGKKTEYGDVAIGEFLVE
jgi:hypothetical protein